MYHFPLENVFTQLTPAIHTMELRYLPINNEAFETLDVSFPKLKKLDLARCSKLTDQALVILAKGFKSLKYLNLYGCSRMTLKGFKEFRAMRPEIKHHLYNEEEKDIDYNFSLETNCFKLVDRDIQSDFLSSLGELEEDLLGDWESLHVEGPKMANVKLEKMEIEDNQEANKKIEVLD